MRFPQGLENSPAHFHEASRADLLIFQQRYPKSILLQYKNVFTTSETEEKCKRSLRPVRGTVGTLTLGLSQKDPTVWYVVSPIGLQLGRREVKMVPEPTVGDTADLHSQDKENRYRNF